MSGLIFLIALSFFLYWVLTRREASVFVRPTLEKIVFYREYILLTMLPYGYYLYEGQWSTHYILGQLDGDGYFLTAGCFAFIFIVIFLISYKGFYFLFKSRLSRINIYLNEAVLLVLMRGLLAIFCIFFVLGSMAYSAGVVGLAQGLTEGEMAVSRHFLSQSGGVMLINKIMVKSWIPMLSYLYFYLYLTSKKYFGWVDKLSMISSFFLGLGAAIYFFEKAVLVFYLFGFAGVYVFSGRYFSRYFLLLAIMVALAIVALMYLVIYQDRIVDLEYLIDIIVHRIATQSVGSVMALDYFAKYDFTYFSGVSNFLASLEGREFGTPYSLIIKYYSPDTADISGSLSSFVTGEAYGLFGVLGVFVSGFVVGLYYSFFEAIKFSRFFAILFVGVYGLYFSHFYVASSFYSFLWPVGLVYNLTPFVLVLWLSALRWR